MKKILLYLTIFFLSFSANAQIVDILANPSTSSGPSLGGNVLYVANESIYTETEIGAGNFILPTRAIEKIGFYVNAVGSPTTFNNVKVYFKEVPIATTTFVTGTYTAAGYTQVFGGASGGSVTATATGLVEIILSTTFQRTAGNNLQVLIERTDATLHPGFIWRTANGNNTSSTVTTCRRYSGAAALSGSTSLTASSFRAQIRFVHDLPNDAGVTQVYTLGKLPIPNATPNVVTALITNSGTAALTSLPVTLSVSGSNSFTNVQTIPSLASGASTIVTFAAYVPTVAGNDAINVSLNADDDIGNNSRTVNQTVNINTWSYAQGTVPTGAVGFTTSSGDLLAKFSTNIAAAIAQVSVNFATSGQSYKIGVWDATGAGGSPGAFISETGTLTSAVGVNTIPISPVISVPTGNFFVGIRQLSTTVSIAFSFQNETPIRTNSFYFTTPTGGTTWNDFAPNNPFRFMIEPKLQLAVDAGVSNIVLPYNGSITCNTSSETITARVNNTGTNAIAANAATVTIKIAGANPQTFTSTNTAIIAGGGNEIITFSGLNFLNAGQNFDTVFVSLPGDVEKTNDTTVSSHFTTTVISTFPSVEDVEAASLTSFKWISVVSGARQLWGIRSTAYTNADQLAPLSAHGGSKFMLFDSYSGTSSLGFTSRFFSDCFAVPATGCPYQLSFWMSHDNTTGLPEMDSMYVSVSTNKGVTWTRQNIVSIGAGLQRHDATLTLDAAPVWRKDTVDLSSFAGQTIQIGFEGVSKYGNAFGLDDITVGSAAANNIALQTTVSTYPLSADCDDLGWTYYKDGTGKNVLAVEWGSNTASKAAATASLTLDAADYTATSGSGATAAGTFTMKRYWNIDVAGVQPTTPVNVRFFYDAAQKTATDAAAAAFQTANAGSTLEIPNWFKTNSGAFVGDAAHVNATQVLNAIPLTNVNTGAATINGVLYAQFNAISSFSGGTYAAGVGTGTVLPISIEFFKGKKHGIANYLDWKVSCTTEPSLTLTLERSADGRNFNTLNDQNATATRCLQGFDYTDVSPLAGANYYRLKVIASSGKVYYSTVVVLLNKEKGFELISVSPNPTKNVAILTLTSVKLGNINIVITDIIGKVVAKLTVNVIAGNNPIDMNFATLGAGTYTITATNTEGEIKTTRFVKY